MSNPRQQSSSPYPPDWDRVAEIRVFRTTPHEWERLLGWRADMKRKGWRLLQVFSEPGAMAAVFGRTKKELLVKSEQSP